MINSVSSGYANPQAMMRQNNQVSQWNIKTVETREKKQRTLEEEKQSIQNSLLLLKTTSGDSVEPEESIKLLEKKLEEIENEMRARENAITTPSAEDGKMTQESGRLAGRRNFDLYYKEEK